MQNIYYFTHRTKLCIQLFVLLVEQCFCGLIRPMGDRRVSAEYAKKCYGLRLKRLERIVTRLYELRLSKVNLTLSQLNILSAVDQMGTARPSELSALLQIEKSSLSRSLSNLDREKLILISPRRGKKIQFVRISVAGAKKLAGAYRGWLDAQKDVASFIAHDTISSLDAATNSLSKTLAGLDRS